VERTVFENFPHQDPKSEARRRFSGALAAAVLIHCGMGAVMAATASGRPPVRENLVEVMITALPEAAPEARPEPENEPEPETGPATENEPPPAMERAARRPRPAPPRHRPKQPRVKRRRPEPPEEPLQEAPGRYDGALAEAAAVGGTLEGFVVGEGGGTGTAAAPPPPPPPPPSPPVHGPEPLTAPVADPDNRPPVYPASARRRGIEGVVVIAFYVQKDGTVCNVRVLSGPRELREPVRQVVAGWRFTPARRGARAVRYELTRRVRFCLENA
jgi:protein TonB